MFVGGPALLAPNVARPMAFAWLLPALALTSASLALMTWLPPRRSAAVVAVVWFTAVVLVEGGRVRPSSRRSARSGRLVALVVAVVATRSHRRPPVVVRPHGVPRMTAAHVRADAVAKRFRGREVLAGVHLLEQGGLITVLGPNGAGKTTLLRCLATVVAPDEGTVTIDGLDPRRETERIEIRRRLGYLPQDDGLVAGSTAFDVGRLPRRAEGPPRRPSPPARRVRGARPRRVCASERASGWSGCRAACVAGSGSPRRCSGSPTLMLLDEPASGLDPDERLRLREILTERRRTTTMFVSTHLTDEAAISDTVLVLDDGVVRFAGTPERLAEVARGRTWVQHELPATRCARQLAHGRRPPPLPRHPTPRRRPRRPHRSKTAT